MVLLLLRTFELGLPGHCLLQLLTLLVVAGAVAALVVLWVLQEERAPMLPIINTSFPVLLSLMQQLVANPAPTPQAGVLQPRAGSKQS